MLHSGCKIAKNGLICNIIEIANLYPQDGVLVQNISKKEKKPCHCSKISLHKNFKLSLEQNVCEQTYPKISLRSQKYSVQS